jgi:hypothetical protein
MKTPLTSLMTSKYGCGLERISSAPNCRLLSRMPHEGWDLSMASHMLVPARDPAVSLYHTSHHTISPSTCKPHAPPLERRAVSLEGLAVVAEARCKEPLGYGLWTGGQELLPKRVDLDLLDVLGGHRGGAKMPIYCSTSFHEPFKGDTRTSMHTASGYTPTWPTRDLTSLLRCPQVGSTCRPAQTSTKRRRRQPMTGTGSTPEPILMAD